jgi:hypothetical protein
MRREVLAVINNAENDTSQKGLAVVLGLADTGKIYARKSFVAELSAVLRKLAPASVLLVTRDYIISYFAKSFPLDIQVTVPL